jgi:MFS-type transporter involved in bile tolerance (Atg22 family)
MSKTTIKSIGAVLAGLIFIVITHTGTDAILEGAGVLPKGHLFVGTGLILLVLAYRAVFSLIGCYLTARLAPSNPMKHALILGLIGLVLSSVGAIAAADLGPAWYAWTLAAMALPIAWLGGKLHERRKTIQPARA